MLVTIAALLTPCWCLSRCRWTMGMTVSVFRGGYLFAKTNKKGTMRHYSLYVSPTTSEITFYYSVRPTVFLPAVLQQERFSVRTPATFALGEQRREGCIFVVRVWHMCALSTPASIGQRP